MLSANHSVWGSNQFAGQALWEGRLSGLQLLPQPLLIPKECVNRVFMRQIERNRSINVFEGANHRERAINTFRRHAVLKSVHDTIQRDSSAGYIVTAVSLVYVLLHNASLLRSSI